jgi:cyclopropane fatty-acyl-phospholipid synthase-like methyltransferase
MCLFAQYFMLTSREISPVTGQAGTSLTRKIAVKKITEVYQKDGMEVGIFFRDLEEIEIRCCNVTGYRYYYPFDIFGDAVFYEQLQNNHQTYYPRNKWEHLKAIQFIKPAEHILEVGCGTGHFLDLIQQAGASCVGLEFNKKAIAEATQRGFRVHNEFLMDHAARHEKVYDVVASFQVLEHIPDVKDYFDSARRCLKPGGRLIIGVPNSNPYLFRHDLLHTLNLPPHHAGLWNKETFEKVANYFELDIIQIQNEPLIQYKQWYQVQAAHIKTHNPWLGRLMLAVPQTLYKQTLRIFSPWIAGQGILAVFKLR